MDFPWGSEHFPSECAKHPRWNTASDKPIQLTAERLRKNTRALAEVPYEPGLWLLRAQLLLALGYPELAAGDAYKARLLVDAARDATSNLCLKARLQCGMCLLLNWHRRYEPGLGMSDERLVTVNNIVDEMEDQLDGYEQQAYSILIIALQHLDCIVENLELSKEASAKFGPLPSDDTGPFSQDFQQHLENLIEAKKKACKVHVELAEDAYLTKKVMLNGVVTIRRYPWVQKGIHLKDRNVQALDKHVRQSSQGRCTVKQSAIKGAQLGVFALRPISSGVQILEDHTYTATTSEGGRCLTCCKRLSEGEAAASKFCCRDHGRIAGSKFLINGNTPDVNYAELEQADLVRHNRRNPLGDLLLLQRFLSIAVKHTLLSTLRVQPLAVPEIARLAANYQGEVRFPWNFLQAIVLPNRILQTLGVDIFVDQRFDTWVIHTIWYRISNNQAGGIIDGFRGDQAPSIQGVYPCHSLFNHSCEPNVTYDDHPTQAAQVMRVKRDIVGGEELYISYDLGLDAPGMSVWERREALRNWMGGECRCAKCVRESAEASLGPENLDLKMER